jgi:hypothetical protein
MCSHPQRLTAHRLLVEALEDRTVPSASPLPIPGLLFPAVPGGNPLGGPAIHFDLPGPADNTTQTFPRTIGGEPSSITNFNGFIGGAHVEGTGTDNHGTTLFWDVDLRFMKGVFQGDDGRIRQGTFAFV